MSSKTWTQKRRMSLMLSHSILLSKWQALHWRLNLSMASRFFYIDYSGTHGGPEDVNAAAKYLDETCLFYGGGIESHQQTTEILNAGADAVVVGDCFHENPPYIWKRLAR
nr:geranylgeranylglyceryl/heptaprenylglyceryl phosphate synthase [Haloarcula mannanilytica]